MFSPALRCLSYRIFAWILETLPFALPLKRLGETEHLLAFHQPRSADPFHVIPLARRGVRTSADLSPDEPFPCDPVTAVQSLVSEYRLWSKAGNTSDTRACIFT